MDGSNEFTHGKEMTDGFGVQLSDPDDASPAEAIPPAMLSYDPNELIARARRWRGLAAHAAAPHRDVYLRLAAKCEELVEHSIRTPPIC